MPCRKASVRFVWSGLVTVVFRNELKDHAPTMDKPLDATDAPGRADSDITITGILTGWQRLGRLGVKVALNRSYTFIVLGLLILQCCVMANDLLGERKQACLRRIEGNCSWSLGASHWLEQSPLQVRPKRLHLLLAGLESVPSLHSASVFCWGASEQALLEYQLQLEPLTSVAFAPL
jgi:hypothetical protein